MKAALRNSLLALAVLFFARFAFAGDVILPAQHVSICVGKSGVVMHTKTQLKELVVNGITSKKSTFNVKTPHARLTCDFDTAHSIVARCRTPGTQTVDVIAAFAYADPNRYHVQITVECRNCEKGEEPRE